MLCECVRGSDFFFALFGTGKHGAVYGDISEKLGDGATCVKAQGIVCQ